VSNPGRAGSPRVAPFYSLPSSDTLVEAGCTLVGAVCKACVTRALRVGVASADEGAPFLAR
jgi:hypothetical protein